MAALDLKKTYHGEVFLSKVLSGIGGGHIYNITLAENKDNGELVLRGGWNSFDNYDEKTGKVTFEGVIREVGAHGGYYIEVTKATDALLVYNTPKSPYKEEVLRDDRLFYNEEGDTVSGHSLVVGDIFEASVELFKTTPVIGKTVTFADHKYVVAE